MNPCQTGKSYSFHFWSGSTAEKLRKLPKSRYPQEVIIQYIVKNGIFSCQDLSLLATAVKNMVEGNNICSLQSDSLHSLYYGLLSNG